MLCYVILMLMLCYVMFGCDVLCYVTVMLCYVNVMLVLSQCHVMLCYAILCYGMEWHGTVRYGMNDWMNACMYVSVYVCM